MDIPTTSCLANSPAVDWQALLQQRLQAAVLLINQGQPELSQPYYQELVPILQQWLLICPSPLLQTPAQALLMAIRQNSSIRQQHRLALVLLHQLQDGQQSPRYGILVALLVLVLSTFVFVANRIFEPYPAQIDHSQYLTLSNTPQQTISTWLELGREGAPESANRPQFPGEAVYLPGFQPVQWPEYTYPPTVNWAVQAISPQSLIQFQFPANIGKTGVKAVSVFVSDGDHRSIPRAVMFKMGQQRVLSAPAPHGEWLKFEVTPEEQAAGQKTIQVLRLAGENPALSAAVFWHGQ